MNPKRTIFIVALISLTMFLLVFSSCSSQKSFRDETITAENKAEILSKADSQLTVEEGRLLGQYLERSYPQLAKNDLPIGRTLTQMITEERAVAASSQPQQAEAQVEAEPETAAVTNVPAKGKTAAPAAPKPKQAPAAPQAPAPQSSAQVTSQPQASTPAEATNSAHNAEQIPPAAAIPEVAVPEAPKPIIVEVEPGTDIQVRLVEALGTDTAQTGDRFELQLADDLVVGDHLIAPKGSRARGRVLDSQAAGKVKGLATISLILTDLYIGQDQFPLQTETLTYQAEKTTGKDAAKVGIGAGVGAILGAIIGGKKGAAIGAGVGAGAGTTTVLATKGDELEFPVEQMFRFRLTQGFKVEVLED